MVDSLPRLTHLPGQPYQEPNSNPVIGLSRIWSSAFAALLAVPIILACEPHPLTVTSIPAARLHFTVNINDQYAATPQVLIHAQVSLPGESRAIVATTSHTLTCNGVSVIAGAEITGSAMVPRQPPGGTYTFIYTDEHGQRTTQAVPVPPGQFAVDSPSANSSVPIPGTSASRNVSPALVIRFTTPSTLAGASATAQASVVCDRTYQVACGGILGPTVPATGLYTLADQEPNGFASFTPGPGEVSVIFAMAWSIPASGFAAAQVQWHDLRIIPINWTR